MAGIQNYDISQMKNPATGQMRVTPRHDNAAVLFESDSIPAGANAVSRWLDIRADEELALFIKTAVSFTVTLQFTDDDSGDNVDYFENYDSTNTIIAAFTATFNPGRRIPVKAKAIRMRLVLHNNGATADTPYVGVI